MQQMIVADRVKTIAAMASGISHHLRDSLDGRGRLPGRAGRGETPAAHRRRGGPGRAGPRAVAEAPAGGAGGGLSRSRCGPRRGAAEGGRRGGGADARATCSPTSPAHAPPGGRVTVAAECARPAREHDRRPAPGPRHRAGLERRRRRVLLQRPSRSRAAAGPRPRPWDLLESYRVAQGHGGELLTHKAAPLGPGFELRLPLSIPPAARRRRRPSVAGVGHGRPQPVRRAGTLYRPRDRRSPFAGAPGWRRTAELPENRLVFPRSRDEDGGGNRRAAVGAAPRRSQREPQA